MRVTLREARVTVYLKHVRGVTGAANVIDAAAAAAGRVAAAGFASEPRGDRTDM